MSEDSARSHEHQPASRQQCRVLAAVSDTEPSPGVPPETVGTDGLTDSERLDSARRYELATTLTPRDTAAARHNLRHTGELIIGLDGEMSGNDLDAGSALIQVGLAMWTPTGLDVFSQLLNPGAMQWQPDAEAVHGIARSKVEAAAPAVEVDAVAAAWLTRNGAPTEHRAVIGTGFNVAGFDFPFFNKYLPQTMALISRRSIDLNALCFALAGWDPVAVDSARDWSGWRRSARKQAAVELRSLGVLGSTHDAGWDAAEALLAFRWLRQQIHECSRPSRTDSNDPLVQVFGSGLLHRLRSLNRDQLVELADRLTQNNLSPGKWLGTRHSTLGGRTGLQAVLDGDFEMVLALFREPSAQDES